MKIQPDGTFNNSTCNMPISGRIRSGVMELHNDMPNHDGSCDHTYKPEAAGKATTAPPSGAADTKYLPREPPPGTLAPGVRVLVDNGTCPAGQVYEVIGSPSAGVPRAKKCIARID